MRLFSGLNAADARRELIRVGRNAPSPEEVERLRRWATVKVTAPLGWGPFVAAFRDEILDVVGDPERGSALVVFRAGNAAALAERLGAGSGGGPLLGDLRALIARYLRDGWRLTLPGGGVLVLDRPVLMGVVNVTPDSFSDGGRFLDPERAASQALALHEAGAAIVDLGAESTRPGAEAVPAEAEWARLEPVLERLVDVPGLVLSVDTYKADVARRCLERGAHLVNDISGLTLDPELADVAAEHGSPLVLMHIQGRPRTMQEQPCYDDLMAEVMAFLERQGEAARRAGVAQLVFDPGIGFGKTLDHNLELLRRLGELRALGVPLLLGPSRKSFIGKMTGAGPAERLPGTIAAVLQGMRAGARVFRVHDVAEVHQAMRVWAAMGDGAKNGIFMQGR